MESSTALRWFLAVLALAAAAYHLGHAAYARSPRRPGLDVDLLHAAMGVAMAVMFVGGLGRAATLWLVGGFAAGTLWFLVGATATYIDAGPAAAGERTRQSLCCVVMTGMLAVTLLSRSPLATATSSGMTTMTGMSGMTGMPGMDMTSSGASIDSHALLYALLAVQAVVVAWTAGSGRPRAAVSPAVHRHSQLAGVHRYSQLATGVTSACMLAMML